MLFLRNRRYRPHPRPSGARRAWDCPALQISCGQCYLGLALLRMTHVPSPLTVFARRFWPTAADILRSPEEHRLGVANWQERPSASAERNQQSMAQHYANNKVFTSARIKQKVMLSILLAAQRVSFKLSWDDFRQNLPSLMMLSGASRLQQQRGAGCRCVVSAVITRRDLARIRFVPVCQDPPFDAI